MKYTKLGNSDLNVSRICMGCMGFGDPSRDQHSWTIDEAHTREIIKRGLELGVNFYDTAIAYQSGTGEQYVGRVAELSEKHGVTMTEISLAWLLTKVTSPVVGATKLRHIEGAAKAVELTLSDEEITYLSRMCRIRSRAWWRITSAKTQKKSTSGQQAIKRSNRRY